MDLHNDKCKLFYFRYYYNGLNNAMSNFNHNIEGIRIEQAIQAILFLDFQVSVNITY